MLFINYDGSGSYLYKWFGIDVEIPLAVMFFQDLTANFLDYFLPVSGMDGFDNEKVVFVLRNIFGLYPVPFQLLFMDFGTKNNSKTKLPKK